MIGSITELWTAMVTWIVTTFGSIEALFWTGEALTTLGSMCFISIGIGLVFLVIGVITNFAKLRS